MSSSVSILDNWQQHLQNWMERLAYIKQNDKLTDFQFIVGPEKMIFNAHKLIFAASSPEFENLFYLLESKMIEIELPDNSPESFKDFMSFIYTGKLEITQNNVIDLLDLSQLYLITNLSKKCEVFLIEKQLVENDNVLKFLDLMSPHDKLPRLEPYCLKIVQENALELLQSPDFLEVSLATIEKIVEIEMLSCKEIKLFKAVNKWSNFECKRNNLKITSENKRSVVGDIILKIRFGAMSLNEFGECTKNDSPLTKNEIINILQGLAGSSKMNSRKRIGQRKLGKFIRFVDGPSKNQVLEYPQCRNVLSISVNRKVFLLGCGMYGRQPSSMETNSKTKVTIQLEDADGLIKAENSEEITFDGTERVYEILFKSPIRLTPFKEYKFSKFSADDLGLSYCGINGSTDIRSNGVLFKIRNFHDKPSLGSIASFIFRS